IYALQNKLGVGLVKNKSGNFIEPKLESVTAAAANVAQTIAPDLRASIVDAPGADAFPISGFTWLLAYEQMDELPKAIALTRLLLLDHGRVGPRVREVRGSRVHLWDARDLHRRSAAGHAGRGGHGVVPGGILAKLAAGAGRFHGRAAGGDPKHHLRALGLLRP